MAPDREFLQVDASGPERTAQIDTRIPSGFTAVEVPQMVVSLVDLYGVTVLAEPDHPDLPPRCERA